MKKIAIIGGGLAGISAARYGLQAGFNVELFEASDRCGGRVAHDVIDAFTLDRGFQVVNTHYPELKRLLGNRETPATPIFSSFNFPTKSGRKTASAFNPIHWFSQLLRLKEIFRWFLSGVFLIDSSEVSPKTKRSIISYFVKGRPSIVNNGVGSLISHLVTPISSSNIHYESKVREISQHGSQLSVTIEKHGKRVEYSGFDYVVIATNGAPSSISGTAGGNQREWNSSTTVYHRTTKNLSRFTSLFLGDEMTNSLVISNANPTLAPANEFLISTTYLGALSESEWQKTRDKREADIASLYGLDPSDISLLSVVAIPHSLPRFSRDKNGGASQSIVDALDSRIIYAGDSFDEPSQNGALRSGRRAIEKISQLDR